METHASNRKPEIGSQEKHISSCKALRFLSHTQRQHVALEHLQKIPHYNEQIQLLKHFCLLLILRIPFPTKRHRETIMLEQAGKKYPATVRAQSRKPLCLHRPKSRFSQLEVPGKKAVPANLIWSVVHTA